jgi:pimeloyl-ACP methyl ester carboxylesterase
MKKLMAASGDQHVEYDDAGEGDVVLLALPGWCVHRTLFAPLAERLARKHRVITLDWRGHGGSSNPTRDFGAAELVDDAMAVIDQSGAREVVPIAQAHAGWIAVELRRRLGKRVPAMVCTSWLLGDPPPAFREALAALQDRDRWMGARDKLLGMWLTGAPPNVVEQVRGEMISHGFDMWSRGGREIAAAYDRDGSAVRALDRLDPPVRVLHLFAQPRDPAYLDSQRSLASERAWLSVERVDAASHFPTLEIPDVVTEKIETFLHAS